MIRCNDGKLWHGTGGASAWPGSRGLSVRAGDVLGLLVRQGTMTLFMNGECVGMACGGLHGRLCWVAELLQPGESVRIERKQPQEAVTAAGEALSAGLLAATPWHGAGSPTKRRPH